MEKKAPGRKRCVYGQCHLKELRTLHEQTPLAGPDYARPRRRGNRAMIGVEQTCIYHPSRTHLSCCGMIGLRKYRPGAGWNEVITVLCTG